MEKVRKIYCFCQDYLQYHGCCSRRRLQSAKHRFKVNMAFYDENTGSAIFLQWTWAQPTTLLYKKALQNHRLVALLESKCCM